HVRAAGSAVRAAHAARRRPRAERPGPRPERTGCGRRLVGGVMLATVGFVLLAFMFTVYVLLDGYDLGIGSVSPFVTRNGHERGALMRAIGPFWNGNEVWLIAAGATLFGLFPEAY